MLSQAGGGSPVNELVGRLVTGYISPPYNASKASRPIYLFVRVASLGKVGVKHFAQEVVI